MIHSIFLGYWSMKYIVYSLTTYSTSNTIPFPNAFIFLQVIPNNISSPKKTYSLTFWSGDKIFVEKYIFDVTK